jgi:hypothetical protein
VWELWWNEEVSCMGIRVQFCSVLQAGSLLRILSFSFFLKKKFLKMGDDMYFFPIEIDINLISWG